MISQYSVLFNSSCITTERVVLRCLLKVIREVAEQTASGSHKFIFTCLIICLFISCLSLKYTKADMICLTSDQCLLILGKGSQTHLWVWASLQDISKSADCRRQMTKLYYSYSIVQNFRFSPSPTNSHH